MDGTLARALCGRPLALAEQGFAELLAAEDAPPEFRAAAQARKATNRNGGVAVIPIFGALSRRDNLMSWLSGGTSVDTIRANFRAALLDDSVSAILFDIDSPGGDVDGIDELAAEIRNSPKPTLAIADGAALSAAYWLGASADEMVSTPSGLVGAIGIWTAHQDVSKAAEQAGITTTLISAGKKKVEASPFFPLSDEARAGIQEQADTYYGMFARTVALGRQVSVDVVKGATFGEGAVVMAKKAETAGMVDRVETFDSAVGRLLSGQVQVRRRGALAASNHADLGSGLPFSDRLALVSAGVRGLVEHAEERADMRAKQGRSLSTADRQGLLALAGSLTDVAADEEPETEPHVPTPDPDPTPPARTAHRRAQVALALAELGA